MSQYTFLVKCTPKGKHFVEVYQGSQKVAVSRKTYGSGEEALTDARNALVHSNLAAKVLEQVVDLQGVNHA